jgi:hypothetical protein
MAKKVTKAVEPASAEPVDPLKMIEARVCELEALRKSNPGSFHSNLARKEYGPNFKLAAELADSCRHFAARLERLK